MIIRDAEMPNALLHRDFMILFSDLRQGEVDGLDILVLFDFVLVERDRV